MILPQNYALSFAIVLLGMLCWACWAGTLKLTGAKWRFELFYIDFAVGVLLAALIAGLTFGTLGWDGFSLADDLRIAGKRQEFYAFIAGCVFNLGNILFVGAISLTGLAVAFPVAMGLALVIGTLAGWAAGSGSGTLMTFVGCGVVLAASTLAALAWQDLAKARFAAIPPDTTKVKPPKKQVQYRGIVAGAAGGLIMGSFYPLVGMARAGENGLGPYSACLIFAVGVLLSTFLFDLFLMNLPLQGKPVEMAAYFRGTARQHSMGLLGGVLWMMGTLCIYVAGRAEGPAQVGPVSIWAAGQAAPILAALLGILVWKELAGAGARARALIGAALFLYLGGIAIVAEFYGPR